MCQTAHHRFIATQRQATSTFSCLHAAAEVRKDFAEIVWLSTKTAERGLRVIAALAVDVLHMSMGVAINGM